MNWNRAELLAALHLYMQLPFGQLHHRHPRIRELAQWLERTPSSLAMKLTNLASLDPQIVASGRKGLSGASALDRAVWKELQSDWDAIALAAAAEYEHLAELNSGPPRTGDSMEPLLLKEGRTRSVWSEARINQGYFRKAVLASYNATCCISGLHEESLVIASHIVPWSKDDKNRLNPQNGLCLSALHDRAFDQGLLTVTPEYRVRVSPRLKHRSADRFLAEAVLQFDGQAIRMPERFKPAPEFLEWHGRTFGLL